MKKLLLLLLTISVFFTSCKKDEKKPETENTPVSKAYVIDPAASSISWTAYKTTAKTPVTGKFTRLTINNPIESKTMQGALNGLDFEIPVSSFFSNNDIRFF